MPSWARRFLIWVRSVTAGSFSWRVAGDPIRSGQGYFGHRRGFNSQGRQVLGLQIVDVRFAAGAGQ